MQLPQWARPSSMAVECFNLTFQIICKLYAIVIMSDVNKPYVKSQFFSLYEILLNFIELYK